MQRTRAGTVERILAELEGDDCVHCESGQLIRQRFKDTPAVVCDACDAPQARFF